MKTSVLFVSLSDGGGGGPRCPLAVRIHDSGRGCPAQGVPVYMAIKEAGTHRWQPLDEGITKADGTATMLHGTTLPQNATYRLDVDSATYFTASGQSSCCQKLRTTFRLSGEPNHQQLVSIHMSPAGYSLTLG
ncbi:transthyretin-like isoform X2 [Babylonia areolata]|uniref:transthyretin-like isoform X2 n=1 Tax=Babylonia areolata TaxID=304850 RepID=UPI003FD038BE